MRIAPRFLTLLKRYVGLKHLLTRFSLVLNSLVIVEVLSGSISGLRRLDSLSIAHYGTLVFTLLYYYNYTTKYYITRNMCACLMQYENAHVLVF
jgi:hypothetical protein